ncbi:MAG: NAD(P) transhydrogenase subunit alpha [Vicinamibacterales bacterium]
MTVGVAAEIVLGERRAAVVPAGVRELRKAGLDVIVQADAGANAGFSDDEYREAGARIEPRRADVFAAADAVLQVHVGPGADGQDLRLIRSGQTVVGLFDPLVDRPLVEALARSGATSFSLQLLPRITRAQPMDVLSSMATVAGYKAVIVAAAALPKMMPMLMTAAGTVAPARVLVIGAGVAGLMAIATARRLGARVEAYDVRPAAREQVQSLGARFLELPLEIADSEDASGYARAQDEDFYRRQRELLARAVSTSDIVITTAVVPGRKAPILVTRSMLSAMAPGSVIVDLAAERGGNCEATRPDDEVVESGVLVLGPTNLAATVPGDASRMYSRNATAFLLHLAKGGELHFKEDDEIVKETLVTRSGEIVHPRLRQEAELPGPATTERSR